MTEDEKYVREQWKRIQADKDFGFHFTFGTSTERPYLFVEQQESWDAAWSAAAEFTRTRLQQIRDVEEEIAWIKLMILRGTYIVGNEAKVERILAREQAALADLKRGLRVAE